MGKKITMKEIAAITGTSVSTVSKALNQSPEISESTRRRIIEIARANHYHFDRMENVLPEEKQRIVGFLVPDVSNPYFARLWRGVEDIARAHDYSVVACHTGEDPELEVEQLARIQRLDVAGLLAVPIREENYRNIHIPFLFLSRCSAAANSISYVINNDFRGAYLAAKYFLENGKQTVFFLSGPENISVASTRTQGIQTAFREKNLPFPKSHIFYDNLKFKDGHRSLERILKTYRPPFGVFCSSDIVAIGALSAARSCGYKIPEEISIVGYDDIENDQYLDYPLTTIAQADYQIGSHGMKMLVEIISSKEPYRQINQIMFEPEIIIRKT
ncbi:LacI family DNA-binding transcriptional regulator [Dysosmobacter sp.]|uniref:LacI family DNA-binding transcriptional regulator n=1 Tax=Dysosmobacter sp. TaxID=2591382 RepID=UPI002A97F4AE|nr:LacI family DNA-binding transcriptional regulator [Dysosmobacter sp.]MDY5510749.1 LacI family DNA-binding transcriptional regulator [Dysosmobacter sp.]